jgi:hypothetical protein
VVGGYSAGSHVAVVFNGAGCCGFATRVSTIRHGATA